MPNLDKYKIYFENIERRVKPIIENCRDEDTTRLGFTQVEKDEYGTTVVEISGGLNGSGNWMEYFKSLARLMGELSQVFAHVWLIELKNDCLDDMFYAKIGVRINETGRD